RPGGGHGHGRISRPGGIWHLTGTGWAADDPLHEGLPAVKTFLGSFSQASPGFAPHTPQTTPSFLRNGLFPAHVPLNCPPLRKRMRRLNIAKAAIINNPDARRTGSIVKEIGLQN